MENKKAYLFMVSKVRKIITLFIILVSVYLLLTLGVQLRYFIWMKNNYDFFYLDVFPISAVFVLWMIQLGMWLLLRRYFNEHTLKNRTRFTLIGFNILLLLFIFLFVRSSFWLFITITSNARDSLSFIFSDMSTVLYSICMATYLFMIVFIKQINNNQLNIMRRIFNVFFSITILLKFPIIIDWFKVVEFSGRYDLYRSVQDTNMLNHLYYVIASILGMLLVREYDFINKLLSQSTDEEITQQSRQNIIINSLKNKYWIVIGAATISIHFFYVSITYFNDLVDYSKRRIYVDYVLMALYDIDYFYLLSEVLIFLWLLFIIIFKPYKKLTTSLLCLLILYLIPVIQGTLIMSYYVLDIGLSNSSAYNNFSLTYPILKYIALVFFLYLIIKNLYTRVKPEQILISCEMIVIFTTLNFFTTTMDLFDQHSSSYVIQYILSFKMVMPFEEWNKFLAIIVQLGSMVFWVGFSITYYQQYNANMIQLKEANTEDK